MILVVGQKWLALLVARIETVDGHWIGGPEPESSAQVIPAGDGGIWRFQIRGLLLGPKVS